MPEDPDLESQPEPDSSVITNLRKEHEKAKAEAEAAKRELTIYKAGLTGLNEKQMKVLSTTYDGPWEPEAVKSYADELGFGQQAQEPEPQETISPAEAAIMRQMGQAAAGQPPPPTETEDAFEAAMKGAKTPEELEAVFARSPGFVR
jgi:hypothetical protein